MPVIPTSRPMPNPNTMIAGSIPMPKIVEPGVHEGAF